MPKAGRLITRKTGRKGQGRSVKGENCWNIMATSPLGSVLRIAVSHVISSKHSGGVLRTMACTVQLLRGRAREGLLYAASPQQQVVLDYPLCKGNSEPGT